MVSLSADLGTPETAVTHQIADMVDRPDGQDEAGSVDDCFWDIASIAR